MADPAAANVIAHNAGAGIRIDLRQQALSFDENEIRGNAISNNGGSGIVLDNLANGSIAAPNVTGLRPVRGGGACPNCEVDVYSDDADEGRVYEGTAIADGSGAWQLPGLFSGPNVTATVTNTSGSTSEFSAALVPTTPFTDIGGSSFTADITWLYANGITTGCSATTLLPPGAP